MKAKVNCTLCVYVPADRPPPPTSHMMSPSPLFCPLPTPTLSSPPPPKLHPGMVAIMQEVCPL